MARRRWIPTLLGIGSIFDWISPVQAVIQDALEGGPHRTILISDTNHKSPRNVARMLNAQGVRTWGLMIVDDVFMVTVPADAARHAERLLREARVTVDNPIDDPIPEPGQQQGQPAEDGAMV